MTVSFDSKSTADRQLDPVAKDPAVLNERPQRLQFSLTSLLILTAASALGVVLLKNLGHWGLVCITLASFVFTMYVARKSKTASMRRVVVLLWGFVLPLLCFAYDPMFLHRRVWNNSTIGNAIIATAMWQMVLLLAWIGIGPAGPIANGARSGGMFVGSILAGLIAVPLTLLALFSFWFFGLGIPGFIPLMTTWVYSRNWSQASFLAPKTGRERWRFQTAFAISLVFAAVGPALLVYLASVQGWTFEFPNLAKPDFRP